MVILSQKLKNAVKKHGGEDFCFSLNNILVNGVKRGCSGFITNPETGLIVYVNTEVTVASLGYLYRYARHEKDYTGLLNCWTKSLDDLAESIVSALLAPKQYMMLL